jgi:hypothetical protein
MNGLMDGEGGEGWMNRLMDGQMDGWSDE